MPEDEIDLVTLEKLPDMAFTNITGGEPFIRKDIADIVELLYKKTPRIVISTNGYFTDRIIELCEKYPQIGIRISIEGLEETNNAIREPADISIASTPARILFHFMRWPTNSVWNLLQLHCITHSTLEKRIIKSKIS